MPTEYFGGTVRQDRISNKLWRWIGVTRINEGDAAPSGIVWLTHGTEIWMGFDFLDLIAFQIRVDRANWRNIEFMLLLIKRTHLPWSDGAKGLMLVPVLTLGSFPTKL